MSKRINVHIQNEDIYNDVKTLVKEKYGVLHTNLGLTVEEAFIRLLHHYSFPGYEELPFSDEEDQDSSDENRLHTHKINKTDQKICNYLYSNFDTDATIPFVLLAKFMTEKCGIGNRRTHQEHVKSLILLKVIAQSPGSKKYVKYDILSEELIKFVSPDILVEECLP